MEQGLKNHPGAYQIGEPGLLPGAYFMTEDDFIKSCGEVCKTFPGVQALFQFMKTNQTAFDEFIKSGSPTLNILIPAGQISSGGTNILNP